MSIFPNFINPNVSGGVEPENPYEILTLLGYGKHQVTEALSNQMRKDLWPFELTRVEAIKAELITLDSSIADALADSAITQTCNTQMDWMPHLKMLRQQAHNLLIELARLYDVELAYSKYASYLGRVNYSTQYQ